VTHRTYESGLRGLCEAMNSHPPRSAPATVGGVISNIVPGKAREWCFLGRTRGRNDFAEFPWKVTVAP
jgi:hypothetical protein